MLSSLLMSPWLSWYTSGPRPQGADNCTNINLLGTSTWTFPGRLSQPYLNLILWWSIRNQQLSHDKHNDVKLDGSDWSSSGSDRDLWIHDCLHARTLLLTLHRLSKIVSPPLFLDDRLVDLARGDVVVSMQGDIQKPLIVAQVKVNLTTIIQDKDLTCVVCNRNPGIAINSSLAWLPLTTNQHKCAALSQVEKPSFQHHSYHPGYSLVKLLCSSETLISSDAMLWTF